MLHDWSRSKLLFAWSQTGLLLCLHVKIFLPSIFYLIHFWISLSLIVIKRELTEKNTIRELGLFNDGSKQGFSFCPPKTFKPNKQTTWNKSHLLGITWSSGKLFAVFYDIKVKNAEVFAERFRKCRLFTRLLKQNVENLDDYACPKTEDLVEEGKANSSWICSSYLLRHKRRLHCAEMKAKSVWRLGDATFKTCKFCTCVLYFCLLLI